MKIQTAMRWGAYFLGLVLVLAVVAFIGVNTSFYLKKQKTYDVGTIESWDIENTAEAVLEGGRLATLRGCVDCHGRDLSGKIMVDDPSIGQVIAPNITRGKGGLPADWSKTDWVRVLKHGLNRQGTSLMVMPSYETTKLSRSDMGALIAFVDQVDPVDKTWEKSRFATLGKLLSVLDELPTFVAPKIDHQASLITHVEAKPDATYGAYLAVTCTGCHRPDLKGGKHPVPGMPEIPDITGSGVMAKHQLESFDKFIRTGKNHEGRQVNPAAMPWPLFTVLTEVEMEALYLYLKSL